jgi:hypothetical protein
MSSVYFKFMLVLACKYFSIGLYVEGLLDVGSDALVFLWKIAKFIT